MLLSLNPSTDQFRKFINGLPYSVSLCLPIKNKEGEIIDFEIKLFNPPAEEESPSLQSWHPGATLRELFKEEAAGLFTLYSKVLDSDVTHKSDDYSPITRLRYRTTTQSFYGGILAIRKLSKVAERIVSTSKDFDSRLAHYKASVYEQYRNYL